MPSANPFFDAVLADPDDDVTRLVYADWLDEQGDPRGEFIRVQVELARTSPVDERWRDLKNRETELLNHYLPEWLGESARRVWKGFSEAHYQPFYADRGSCRLERGFRESARVRARTFLAHEDAIFAEMPLRRLCLFVHSAEEDGDFAEFAASPHLQRLTGLTLDFSAYLGRPNGAILNQVLASEYASNLTELRVGFIHDPTLIVRPIAASRNLARLRTLELRGSTSMRASLADMEEPQPRDGFQILRAASLPALEELVLGGFGLSMSALEALFKAQWFGQLTRLDLSGSHLGDEGLDQLAASSLPSQLTMLRLGTVNPPWPIGGAEHSQPQGTQFTAPGMRALADMDLSALRVLDLSGHKIGSGKLRILLRSQTLTNLDELDLSFNPLRDTGADVLAKAANLRSLTTLSLVRCELTDKGLQRLAYSPFLTNVRRLFVGLNPITGDGVRMLLDSPLASQLRTLSLPGILDPVTGFTDFGVETFDALRRAESLSDLAELDLSGQPLDVDHAAPLVESPHLEHLAHLHWDAGYGSRDNTAISMLEDRWPGRVRT